MPAAYMIAQIDVNDPDQYEEYKKLVPATIAKYDGEYLVRGGKFEALEGEAPAGRMVVLKFPSFERAKEWYNSDEYVPVRAIRWAASEGKSVLVEGFE